METSYRVDDRQDLLVREVATRRNPPGLPSQKRSSMTCERHCPKPSIYHDVEAIRGLIPLADLFPAFDVLQYFFDLGLLELRVGDVREVVRVLVPSTVLIVMLVSKSRPTIGWIEIALDVIQRW